MLRPWTAFWWFRGRVYLSGAGISRMVLTFCIEDDAAGVAVPVAGVPCGNETYGAGVAAPFLRPSAESCTE
jgi:hypothetical protein